jgi:hypothetical protein
MLHGIGGIGKSTLAAQIAARLTRVQPDRAVVTLSGQVSPAILAALPADADLIVLDDFDDNLSLHPDGCSVSDPDLAALLADWTGKLLITCRAPFTLPASAGQRQTARRLGPLTRSGAAELAASLPALRHLDETDRDQAWRLTAGHPLALEYLDALLARGEPFPGVADRITAAIQARTGQPAPRIEPTELLPTAAELITDAAGEQLFGELVRRLSPGARTTLVRASAFRLPVRADVLNARLAQVAECEAARLLTVGPHDELYVHRWTADQVHRHLTEAGQLAAAHRHAAEHWRSEPGPRAALETGYHQARARDLDQQPPPLPAKRGHWLPRLAAAGAAATLLASLAVAASHRSGSPETPAAQRSTTQAPSTQAPGSPPSLATVQAAAARDQAAAWVISQVSPGAIMACDRAMCATLARYGVPAGNLLVLGPGIREADDPLGSNIVLASAALRGTFGARLASVYAPATLASFGTGQARIDVLATAPDGAAAYRTALAADLRGRQAAARQLLHDPRLTFSPAARTQLTEGLPDTRLLLTLATLAATGPLQVTGFGDAGPGASPGLPLRAATLTAPPGAARTMLTLLRAQRPPYLAAHTSLTSTTPSSSVLTVEFAAPAPLDLLPPQPSH